MPKEQLLGLAQDVDRLLAAGAGAAVGSDALRKRAARLREMGKQVAALNPVADAVEKVLQASPKDAGPAFLDLLRITKQIRGNLAHVGVEGKLEPLPSTGEWKTPLNVHELYPIYDALSQAGSNREEELTDAMERGVLGDLRLSGVLLEAQDDGYAPVADLVTQKALPSLGKAVLPSLEASLDLEGKSLDARRLESICLIDPKLGLKYCREALEKGSPALKIKALEYMPKVATAKEAEKVGLEQSKASTADIRTAALIALQVAKSDEALDMLLDKTKDRSEAVRLTAYQSLKEIPHPQTTPRVIEAIHAQLDNLTSIPKADKETKAKATKGKKTTSRRKKETDEQRQARQKREEEMRHVCSSIDVLGSRKDKKKETAIEALLALTERKDKEVLSSTLLALGSAKQNTPEVVATLTSFLDHSNRDLVDNALRAIAELPGEEESLEFDKILDLATRAKLSDETKNRAIECFPRYFEKHKQQILDTLKEVIHGKNRFLKDSAYDVIAKLGLKADSLLEDVLNLFQKGQTGYSYWYFRSGLLNSIVAMDPEGKKAIPLCQELIDGKKENQRNQAMMLLQRYGPKAKVALPKLYEIQEKYPSWGTGYYANWAIRSIEGE